MALAHVDLDGGGSNTAPYETWAKAASSTQTGVTAAGAGGACFVQGAAADTAAAARTLASLGTITNPTRLIGVKDGTTNEGVNIVASDLLVRGTDTLIDFNNSGAGNDIFVTGSIIFKGIAITSIDRFHPFEADHSVTLDGCEISATQIRSTSEGGACRIVDSETTLTTTININIIASLIFEGGEILGSVTNLLTQGRSGVLDFTGVDISGLTVTNLTGNNTMTQLTFKNCKMPASYTKLGVAYTQDIGFVRLIGCSSNTAAKAATSSYPDYEYEDIYGTVGGEFTIVRTGGADDGASGGFAYAMTPHIDATLESTGATLKSPWLSVWLAGGSNTLTVYICNDTASTDFNEDDVWVEFYTPDAGDTAQHDQNFDPADERLLVSSTIITDDTGSTWGTGGNNHQQLSTTETTGFEGEAYVRLHFAKRYAASPATLYLDAEPAVT